MNLSDILKTIKNYGLNKVQLLAVSKMQSSEKIRAMWQCGQKAFGENYLQEALPKIQDLQDTDIEWHFIGHLQRNKTQQLAAHFAWVHSVDRENIAQRLNDQRPAHLPPLNVCIQWNVDDEVTKSGVTSRDEVLPLAKIIQALPRLRLRGLMVLPQKNSEQGFRRAYALFNELNTLLSYPIDTLSMGTSADYLSAMAHGATMVRLGTALFGDRLV